MTGRVISILVLATLIAGCSDILDPEERDWRVIGGRSLDAEVYRDQYDNAVDCLALDDPLPLEATRWFEADTIWVYLGDTLKWQRVAGLWVGPQTIYLSNRNDVGTAQHELIHYLLQTPEHTADFDRCEMWPVICERWENGVRFCHIRWS